MSQSVTGFKVANLVKDFTELKATKGKEYWKEKLMIEWKNLRKGNNNTKWVSIKYRPTVNDSFNRLNVIINGEVHTGQIMPKRPEDVHELKLKRPDANIDVRKLKASIQIQKWSKPVQTQEDKVSLVMEDGKPVLPGDEYLSKYFQFIEFMNEIIEYELTTRCERSTQIRVYLSSNKNIKDTEETVTEIRKFIGHKEDGDTIIDEPYFRKLKETFPKNFELLTKGFITNAIINSSPIIQKNISEKATKNKGIPLPNPITRIVIPFDQNGNLHNLNIHDRTKPESVGGRLRFKDYLVDGKKVTEDNIHKVIVSRCIIDGIICLDSLCFSQVGISLPIKASQGLIITPPVNKNNDIFTICNAIYGDEKIEIPEETKSDSVEETCSNADDFINSLNE